MRIYPKVDAKYKRNLEIVYHPGFVDYMVDVIPPNCQFRIHVSGDFFHRDYVRKWAEIASRRPDVTFYAYTRSWRIKSMWNQLLLLATLFNVNVNLSVDSETGAPTNEFANQMRWCYLTKTDTVPSWVRPSDIIFRSNHSGHKRKRKNDITNGIDPDIRAPLIRRLVGKVCPLEQGRDINNFSCAKCRLCVDKPKAGAHG